MRLAMLVSMETLHSPPSYPSREGSRAGTVVFIPMAPLSSRLASVLLLLCPPGLIQSLKDHITKPTAMAQGRVAHLISGRAGVLPPWVGGSRLCLTSPLSGPSSGVAEQFAITEATLSGWSSLNEEELSDRGGSQDVIQLQDLEGVYLQDGLLFCPPPPAGSLQAFALSNQESPIPSGPLKAKDWSRAKGGLGRAEGKLVGPPNARRWQQSATSLRYVDSSSPSEDEVFYD
uniref:Family with sequence similarity 131 member C n=1 Tax=Naja naja TaxID=35670 RepID=A0A8C6XHC5_NAJNA